ncbi:MAG: glycosyl hydrolase family 28 protein [Bacteroidota bacterium]|nr:glycosyl hydrolase family 28 protein [Bacteroidota bacterium]
MQKKLFIFFVTGLISVSSFAQKVLDITSFGAIADGKTVNTKAIQKAIDSCSKLGGGKVYFPKGTFITGALKLKSYVNLNFETGAVLKGSSNVDDYKLDGITRGMFYGENLTDVAITGEGEINGNAVTFFNPSKMHTYIDFDKKYVRQGQAFFDALKPTDGPMFYEKRPDMVCVIMHSENVKLEGVRFVDAPTWTIRIGDCQNVVVNGISILNNVLVPNSDGIHITISRNVRVSNCNVEAGDDALIVSGFGDEINIDNASYGTVKKTYTYGNKTGMAENIVVTNCILRSFSAGIRIGYGRGNMRNLIFSNIVIHNSNRGILMNAREKGSIENVVFDNFLVETKHQGGTWWGRGEPIHISSFPITKDSVNGTIKDINFKNFKIKSETGIVVWANEMGKVSNIGFDNINLQISNGKNVAAFGGNIDLRPTPDFATNIFKRDLPAILFNNIDQVRMNAVNAKFTGTVPDFYTNGLEVVNSQNFSITFSNFSSSASKFPAALVTKSKNIDFKNNSVFEIKTLDK